MRVFLLSLCSLFTLTISAQSTNQPFCGSENAMSRLLGQNPSILQRHLQIEQGVYQSYGNDNRAGSTYMLPVVVHIIHNGGSENISDNQVQDAIKYLNDAFANVGFYDSTTGVATGIEFCLAKQNPQGQITTGINRVQSSLTNFDMDVQDVTMKNLSRWNPTCYVNVWVVKDICSSSSGCGVAGYAYFPSAHGSNVDGLVVEANYMGSTPGNNTVLIHEMGHYLGLYHVFQGGCTNNNCQTDGDKVCDTPPDQSTAYVNCGSTMNSCTTDAQSGFTSDQPDMTKNYMDYGNIQCFSIFTQGQNDRMHWHIDNVRMSLLTCPSCNNPCQSPITAQFNSSNSNPLVGGSVTFTNQSTGAASYIWYINNLQFSTATSPSNTFTGAGTYIVKLKATGTDTNCIDYFIDTITVTSGAQASFSQSTTLINPGQSVTFTNTSVGATSYRWFVDGVQQSTNFHYTRTFSQSGVYSVYLIVSNSYCSDTTTVLNFVHVGPPCNISFTHSPTNANTCQPVFLTPDTSCKYSSYLWTFCDPNYIDSVKVRLRANTLGANPCGATITKSNTGDYHGFYVNYNSTTSGFLYRVDFGNSINSSNPTYNSVSTPGISSLTNAHGFDVYYENGNYYGFLLSRTQIFRVEFGTSLTNPSPTCTQVTGIPANMISWGHKIQIVKETNNFWLICADRTTSSIVLLFLGNNISNNIQSALSHTVNACSGFSYHKVNGNHYIYASSLFSGVKRLVFGNSLSNTPVISNFQQFGPSYHDDIALYQNCDGSLDGIILKENSGNDHAIVHLDSANADFEFVKYFADTIGRVSNVSRLIRTDQGITCLATRGAQNGLASVSFKDCGLPYSTAQFPPPISYTSKGTYYVRLAVDEGLPTQQVVCNNIFVDTVSSKPINLGPDISNCSDLVVTLHAGPGYVSYKWHDGTTDSINTVYGPGTYHVRVQDFCGNFYSDTVTVTSGGGGLTATFSVSQPSCGQNNGSITANVGAGVSVQWSKNGTLFSTSPSINSLTGGTYDFHAQDSSGCTLDSTFIFVASGGSVTINADKSIMCSGDSAHICVQGSYPAYQWNTGETTACIYAKFAANYWVTVTDNGNCTITSNHLPLTVHPLPSVSITVNGDTLISFNSTNYQWYRNGSPIPGATSSVYVVVQPGNYAVEVTDTNGCKAISTIVPVVPVGLEDLYLQGVNVYPNPTLNNWQLETAEQWLGSEMEVFDNRGRLVYRSRIQSQKTEVSFEAERGIYFLRIHSGERTITAKLVRL